MCIRDRFEYINGEAELYYPYGFRKLVSQPYLSAGGEPQAIQADVYEMGSLLDAFGLFSNYRRPDAERAGVGTDDYAGPTQLMFYKDRYFVRLARSGRTDVDRDAFTTLGKAIADRIPGRAEPPKELAWLDVESRTPQTEAYVAQSVLGYAFFPKGLTAEVQLNSRPARLFVVMTESPEAAVKAVEDYLKQLAEDGAPVEQAGATVIATDPLHKGVMLEAHGKYLVGLANLEESAAKGASGTKAREAILQRVADKLPEG